MIVYSTSAFLILQLLLLFNLFSLNMKDLVHTQYNYLVINISVVAVLAKCPLRNHNVMSSNPAAATPLHDCKALLMIKTCFFFLPALHTACYCRRLGENFKIYH